MIWYFPTDSVLPLAEPKEVEDDVQDVLALAKVNPLLSFPTPWHLGFQDTKIIDELDFVNLAPRKPDWDLKRDIAK